MRRISVLALPIILLALTSCGSTTSTAITCTSDNSACTDPVTGISIAISPTTASIGVDATVPTVFSAQIAGGTNTVIVWKINNITGGNQTLGTIDSNGNYLPPTTVPSPPTITVQAFSFEDPILSASATVTILPLPTVTISPTAFTLQAGAQEPFTGTVTGASSTNVVWLVNNIVGGNSAFGTISASGLYTAPLAPPTGGVVTVTAESQASPNASASATVTISGFSQSSLKGSYAFSLSGKIDANPFFRAGTFTADGAGNLTAGLEDIHIGTTVSEVSFNGTYTIGLDGRGTLQFGDGLQPTNFAFAMVNNGQLQFIGFDNSGIASGQASLQDISTFSLAGFTGTFAFDFTGSDDSGAALSEIGQLTADGAGNLTSGLLDGNDDGTLTAASPFACSACYSVSSNGRGTATISGMQFAFYIVSRGSAKFVEIDARAQGLTGSTTQQAPNTTFNAGSLNGTFAFLQSGSGTNGPIATAGSLITDGFGDILGGTVDQNLNGTATQNVSVTSGTYSFTQLGRGTASFLAGGINYSLVFYMGPAGTAVVQLTQEMQGSTPLDPQLVSDGFFAKMQSSSYSAASVQGNYAIQTAGFSGASAQDFTGHLFANGSGTIFPGTVDINTAGVLTPGEAVTGTYAVASNGRGTLTLNPSADNRNFAIYVVSPSEILAVGIDSGRVASGTLLMEY